MNEKLFRKIPFDKKDYLLLIDIANFIPEIDLENIILENHEEKIIEYTEYKFCIPSPAFINRLDRQYISHLTSDNSNDFFNTNVYDINYKVPVFISYDYEKNEYFYDYESIYKNWKDLFDSAIYNINEILKHAESYKLDFQLNEFLNNSIYFCLFEDNIKFKGSARDLSRVLHSIHNEENEILQERNIKTYLSGIKYTNTKELNISSVYKVCHQIQIGEVSPDTKDLSEKVKEYKKIYKILQKTSRENSKKQKK